MEQQFSKLLFLLFQFDFLSGVVNLIKIHSWINNSDNINDEFRMTYEREV